MNIAARKELMGVLAEISDIAPFMRLGQLVCNLTSATDGPYQDSIWDVEDAELLAAAKEHLASLKRLPPESIAAQIRGHLESEQYAQQAAG